MSEGYDDLQLRQGCGESHAENASGRVKPPKVDLHHTPDDHLFFHPFPMLLNEYCSRTLAARLHKHQANSTAAAFASVAQQAHSQQVACTVKKPCVANISIRRCC
jgi:hypothetical protein